MSIWCEFEKDWMINKDFRCRHGKVENLDEFLSLCNVLHTKKNLFKQAFTCSDKQAFAFKHASYWCYVMCQYKVTTLLLTDKSLYVPHLQGVSCLIMILTFFRCQKKRKKL